MATHCLRLADMPSPHLSPNPDELPGLRAAMRDIQEAIREYYDASTGFVDADTLAAPAKNAIAAIQVLNDLLTNQFSQKQTYAVRAGGMLLWMSSGCWGEVGGDGGEDFAGDVALEAADDLGFGASLFGASFDVGAGVFVVAEPADHDAVEGRVRGSVTASVEAMSGGLAR